MYVKPQIAVLGDASEVIKGFKTGGPVEVLNPTQPHIVGPAPDAELDA